MGPGEKLMRCLACEHEQVAMMKVSVFKVRCENCRRKFMEVVAIQPSQVHGAGRNAVADMGLALLMEAGAGVPDDDDDHTEEVTA